MRRGSLIFLLLIVVTVTCNVVADNLQNDDMKKSHLLRRIKRTLGMKERCVPVKIRKCYAVMFDGKMKRICVSLKNEDCISVD